MIGSSPPRAVLLFPGNRHSNPSRPRDRLVSSEQPAFIDLPRLGSSLLSTLGAVVFLLIMRSVRHTENRLENHGPFTTGIPSTAGKRSFESLSLTSYILTTPISPGHFAPDQSFDRT